jgi:hypothetical protein
MQSLTMITLQNSKKVFKVTLTSQYQSLIIKNDDNLFLDV